jgi:predicted nucleic acid-binding protein
MRIVLDTNVLYAGIRSSRGASRIILEMLLDNRITAVLSPALFLEYVDVLPRLKSGDSWETESRCRADSVP